MVNLPLAPISVRSIAKMCSVANIFVTEFKFIGTWYVSFT